MEAEKSDADVLRGLTDEELDRYILTRLALIGVDLSVLPEEDESAPVDLTRVSSIGEEIPPRGHPSHLGVFTRPVR